MELDIVPGGRAEKEEWDLDRKSRGGDRNQRLPEQTIRRALNVVISKRRTDGRLTQARLPMERNSTPRETPTVYIQLGCLGD